MNLLAAIVNHLAQTTAAQQDSNSWFDFWKRFQANDNPNNDGRDWTQPLDIFPNFTPYTPQESRLKSQVAIPDTSQHGRMFTHPNPKNRFSAPSQHVLFNQTDVPIQPNRPPLKLYKPTITPTPKGVNRKI